jgi:hypothetical protein
VIIPGKLAEILMTHSQIMKKHRNFISDALTMRMNWNEWNHWIMNQKKNGDDLVLNMTIIYMDGSMQLERKLADSDSDETVKNTTVHLFYTPDS